MAAARPNFSTPLKAVTPDPTPPKTVPSGPTLPKAGLPSGGVSVDLASAVNYSVDNVPAPHHPANKAPVVNVMSSGAVPCANANKKYCHVEPVVSDPIVPAKTDEKTRGNKTTTEAKTKSSETCAVRKNKRTPFLGSIARNFQFFREWARDRIVRLRVYNDDLIKDIPPLYITRVMMEDEINLDTDDDRGYLGPEVKKITQLGGPPLNINVVTSSTWDRFLPPARTPMRRTNP